jgi:hypothetical protein
MLNPNGDASREWVCPAGALNIYAAHRVYSS